MDSILSDRALISDWLMYSTMFVVSRVLAGAPLDNKDWIMSCLYTLLGFSAYHLVVKKMVPNNFSGIMNRVVFTWLYVGTMLLVSRLLSGEPLNEKWMMSSLYTILGFNAYDIVTQDLIPENITSNKDIKAAIGHVVQVLSMSVVSRVLSGEELNKKWLTGTLYTCAGFVAFDLVTGKILQ